MGKAHEVTIGADARAFEQGVRKGIINPLEDAEDALDDLGDAASDAGRQGSRDLGKVEDAAEKLERQLRDAQDQTKKLDRGLSDIGDGGARGLARVKEGAQEVQQEIGSNLGEAVSSIRGDLSDLGQVGQDTLGGLAATLASSGPAGIAGAAVLAAGAVGLGRVTAEIEAQSERAEKLRDRLSSAYQDAAEAGRDYLDVSQMIAEANDLIYNPERADEWKQLQEDAMTLQLDVNTLVKASAGDLTAQSVVQKEINDYLESSAAYTDKTVTGQAQMHKGAVELRDRWNELGEATRLQAENADRSRQITSDMLIEAASKAAEFTQEIDEAGNKLIALPDGTEFVIRADTQQATQDVSSFGDDADGVLERLNGKVLQPLVKPVMDTSGVDRALSDLQRRASQGINVKIDATTRGRLWE